MTNNIQWHGLYPATILPFNGDYAIDVLELRRLLRFLAKVRGVNGFLCNGHAGDCWALSREERQRVIQIHVDEVNGDFPIISAIAGESTREVIEQMREAKEAGASAVLVMPPGIFRNVSILDPEMPYVFFKSLSEAVDIPMIVFQHPIFRGNNYSPETLAKLTEIDNVVAIKETVWDIKLYERDLVALRRAPRRISILIANDTLLFPSFVFGHSDGALIGLGTLVPHWVVEMFEAVKKNDLSKARKINDQLYPIVELLYYTPGLNTYCAIKEALKMLGVLTKHCVPRAPLLALTEKNRLAISRALEESGLADFYAKLDIQSTIKS
jgi:4-hydroxy-tetrahydrodipicolinate synthase